MAPLAAHYSEYEVDDNRIKMVVFDLQALAAVHDLDADAMVKINGKWERRDLTGQSKLTFCLDDPAQKLEWLTLVVSNHKLQRPGSEATGTSVTVTASLAPCEVVWVGQAVYDVFYPSGSLTVELFKANDCVATVAPSTTLINRPDGLLTIDYSPTPNEADGYGGVGFSATLTDCNGMQLEGWPVGGLFMTEGPLQLNKDGDQLVTSIVLADDAVNLITLDLDYRRTLRPPPEQ